MLRRNAGFLIQRKARIPVRVVSSPPGAAVLVNGTKVGVTPYEIEVVLDQSTTVRIERAGWQPFERNIAQLLPEDMDIQVRLKREPLHRRELGNAFAPPLLVDKTLYVLHGTALTALDALAQQQQWSVTSLFDDAALSITGPNATEFVNDKTWWFPRHNVRPLNGKRLILGLRTGDLLEVSLNSAPAFRKLATLPREIIGAPAIEQASLLAGRPLVAIGCADGKVRVFDPDRPGTPLWEKPIENGAAGAQPQLNTGAVRRKGNALLALSTQGRLASFKFVDGQEEWSLQLKGTLAETNALPEDPNEALAAVVHADGRVAVVDLEARERAWDLPVNQALDEAHSAIAHAQGVFVLSREGTLKKYARERQPRKMPVWQKPLDGAPALPVQAGANAVYVVTAFNTIYAISTSSGAVLWDYRAKDKPLQLSACGDYVYVTTSGGELLVFNAE